MPVEIHLPNPLSDSSKALVDAQTVVCRGCIAALNNPDKPCRIGQTADQIQDMAEDSTTCKKKKFIRPLQQFLQSSTSRPWFG